MSVLIWRNVSGGGTPAESRRRHPVGPSQEIPYVMVDHMGGASRERQFQDQVVVRIGQAGPPQEVNLLRVGLRCQVAQEAFHFVWPDSGRKVFGPRQHSLPPGLERDRQAELESRRRDRGFAGESHETPRTISGSLHPRAARTTPDRRRCGTAIRHPAGAPDRSHGVPARSP